MHGGGGYGGKDAWVVGMSIHVHCIASSADLASAPAPAPSAAIAVSVDYPQDIKPNHSTDLEIVNQPLSKLASRQIIYATGNSHSYSWFHPQVVAALQQDRDGIYLYRSILPPGLPRVAFVGCEVSVTIRSCPRICHACLC